ncbi:N-acetyltransferase [Mesobacillus subterraneus]|uniref:GNAT family N-acetyltransferase n=2 Tax=Mesobacillus TaxID=2675231 RepID=UPI0020412CA3|nr:N-acetyltransferase [Mesobacillus subterraneus]MCM3572602.1 N-acetyltransferase [Mesobacillus subterraneus]
MNNADYIIRPENPNDYTYIRELIVLAFENGENEASLVELIRESEHFVSGLSLVAAKNEGEIIGHILFSVIHLVTDQGIVPTLGLAPMSVKPDYQNSGIGSDLVNEGIKACRDLGCDHIFVLGHPNFYPRFGFSPTSQFGIVPPFPVPEEVFMALELKKGSLTGLQGKIEYPPAFNSVS